MGKTAAISKSLEGSREDQEDRWFSSPGPEPKGVLLLTHGMNLSPAKMDDLALAFAAAGYEVFRPGFAGHHGKNESYLDVEPAHWERDAREVYAIAEKRAKKLGLSIYLAAYSFSAAVFQSLTEELPFARKIFFAPALATKSWYPVVKVLARIFQGVEYRSMNLKGYFANARGGTKPLLAFDHFLARPKHAPEPVLIWIDPKDELVSYRGVRKLAEKNRWRIEKISIRGSTLRRSFHHLIVTEEALGKKEWTRMIASTLEFLDGK